MGFGAGRLSLSCGLSDRGFNADLEHSIGLGSARQGWFSKAPASEL